VSGRLDAFQWQTPVAALPSDKAAEIEAREFNEAIMSAPRRVEPPREAPAEETPSAAQDNSPAKPVVIEAEPVPAPAPAPSPPSAQAAPPIMTAAPLFRARADLGKAGPSPVPPIIPIVRAPDDPGIDEETVIRDEFAEQLSPSQGQAGGWRGFLSRWGG
jgi:HemY protein